MFQVQATCPTRIDLVGGTLDLWPLYHQLPEKATINLGIDLNATAIVSSEKSETYSLESSDQEVSLSGSFEEITNSQKLPLLSLFLKSLWHKDLPALSIKISAKSPKGAGLGGSSALSIALCSALLKAKGLCHESKGYTEEDLAAICGDLESTLIKSPTGCQDYWGAIRGGLNMITYPYGKPHIETLPLKQAKELCESLVLVYSGQSRDSAINNWSVYQNFFSGEENTVKHLTEIGRVSAQCLEKIKSKDTDSLFDLCQEEWRLRKKLWPGVVTERTEFIDKIACKNGALFTRVCGAGGGGVMTLFTTPEKKSKLIKKLKSNQIEVLEAKATDEGLKVSITIKEGQSKIPLD